MANSSSFRPSKERRAYLLHRCSEKTFRKGLERLALPRPTRQPYQTIAARSLYVTHLALSEGLEDLGNVGGEAHVDEHHLRELREGEDRRRDEFVHS